MKAIQERAASILQSHLGLSETLSFTVAMSLSPPVLEQLIAEVEYTDHTADLLNADLSEPEEELITAPRRPERSNNQPERTFDPTKGYLGQFFTSLRK